MTLPKTIRRMMTRNAGSTGKIHNGTAEDGLTRAVFERGRVAGRFGPGNFGRLTRPAVARNTRLGYWWMLGWEAGRADKGDGRFVDKPKPPRGPRGPNG